MERRITPVLTVEQSAEINKFIHEDMLLLKGLFYKIYDVKHKSLAQMLAEDGHSGKEQHFGAVNPYKSLKDSMAIATQVAINPNQLYIPDSNLLTLDERVALIKKINFSLIEEGIEGFKAIMPDVSTLSQLDLMYQEETGKKLIVGLYACATTETVGSQVSSVGRIKRNGKLAVISCSRDRDNRNVFVVPVFVPVLK